MAKKPDAMLAVAAVLLGAQFLIVQYAHGFQYQPIPTLAHQQMQRRANLLRVATSPTSDSFVDEGEADVSFAGEDDFPPPEVFFPSPGIPGESTAGEDDEIVQPVPRTKKGRKRRAIKRMGRRYISKVTNSEKKRGEKRRAIRKIRRKVLDIFKDRFDTIRLGKPMTTTTKTRTTHEATSHALPTIHEAKTSAPEAPLETVAQTEIETLQTTMPTSDEATSEGESVQELAIDSTVLAEEEVIETVFEEAIETVVAEEPETPARATTHPHGERWAVAAPGVDLSGKWELIVTEEFKTQYDQYLERLGQPKLVRSVALSAPVIGKTMEELIQIDCGQSLLIRGKNVRGSWDRTLIASGATKYQSDFEPQIVPIRTIDGEQVESESWWEHDGTVHVSWMRGVAMYGGGSFFNRRYLEEDAETHETVYVAEGSFIFNDPNKEDNVLNWRFRRMDN